MRLALVFTGSFRAGGVERIVYEVARKLGGRHEVTVFADTWDDSGTPGVVYERVGPMRGPKSLVPLEFARRSTRQVARHDFDRVVSFGVNCPAGDVLWVNSVHAAWLERKGPVIGRLRRFRPVDRALLELERDRYGRRRYTCLIAVAEGVARDLGRLYGVPRGDVDVLPNGFDPEEFSPERRRSLRAEERARLGLADDDVVLLMVANELERKGFPVLVEAVERLGNPRVKILLAGRADPATNKVQWLGPQDDVGRTHAAADLFVLPTQYEAACLSIVEALGSGLPVITTAVEGARDHIASGENGLLQTDPLDAAELASLLITALDPAARHAWAEAAPASVAELTWDRICDRLDAVLAALPSPAPGRRL
jgi:UDP-glucose:(heptosyl)LPS alpha-1,3-glucosyltransferase